MQDKRQPSAMLSSVVAAFGLHLLCSSASASGSSSSHSSSEHHDGARRTMYYQDASCRLETFREFAYESISIDATGYTSQVGFGECFARGATGAITTCDAKDGTSTIETYLDTSCSVHLYSSKHSPECTNLLVEGESCPPGGPGSSSTDCVATKPLDTIHPGHFNLIGSPYKDKFCLQRTGGDHVVPGSAFGIGNDKCSQSPLVRGPRFALTECREDHTVYAQVFSPEDSHCSGDLRLEMVMFPRAVTEDRDGGMCALGKFDDGRQEYYRLKACTVDAETPKNPDIGKTPAPTPSVETSPGKHVPTPIDYNGDGDDEDLRGGSDDDPDDTSEGGDKEREEDKKEEDKGDKKEEGEGDKHKDGDDSSEDGHAVEGQGGKDDEHCGGDGDGCDGLSDNSIFAIAFGVSVAVVICLLSGLLAFAGSKDDSKKVGPAKC